MQLLHHFEGFLKVFTHLHIFILAEEFSIDVQLLKRVLEDVHVHCRLSERSGSIRNFGVESFHTVAVE